ncbi:MULTISPECIES: XrtA/PEP-CTERM system-associated ATPase [unclassified Sphingobium]|uniref:XrtA/PEP-CTERM system-associated ATPase n=1 Tax=unclassified Sphingobium TaxID=2611147 RepID=UPI0035A69AC9
MYDQFYGLQGRPFQLTPDPHYYFESATHRKALSYLGYGLAQGEGFIVITGDIGAGKTTLVGHLMQTIDPARLTAVKIVSTQVEGDDMLRLAAQSFGLTTDGQPKAAILRQIEGFLHAQARAGRRTLLIVDEAQNLPVSAIEELRMLSNFQLGGQSLLQIFLLGQPEFRDLVKSPELEQLRQRVIATHHLEPMLPAEVEPYILHRLGIAGWTGNPAFTPGAFDALYAATSGVPRRLNALASRVLLLGAIEQLHVIDADVVGAVVADMGLDSDTMPQPVAPSALDTVAEDAPAEEELVLEEPAEEEAPVAHVEAIWDAPAEESVETEAELEDPQAEDALEVEAALEDPQAEETLETEAAWEEPQAQEPAEPETLEEPEAPAPQPLWSQPRWTQPAVFDPDPVDDEDEPAFAAPPRFLRPAFAAPEPEAEPEVAVEHTTDDPISYTQDIEIEEEKIEHIATAVQLAVQNDAETLRADMTAEIEALRAEIASLRAMQAHPPFGAPAQPEIDPEALKGCFTLIEERLSSLEFRAEEQDTALRRVLTLLVDWVEREEQTGAIQAVA